MKKLIIFISLFMLITPIMIKASDVTIDPSIESIPQKQEENKEKSIDEEQGKDEITKETLEEETTNESLLANAKAGMLIEASTGEIIFKKNENEKLAVASMTKMMAQIIILEHIEEGKIKWTDVIEVSKNASDMGGSQIYLNAGEKMTIKDLFKGISMASANDATVQMAEVISGTEENFVKLMNKKVKKLGLKNTHFSNCTGLDTENHYSTASDMAAIARELVRHEEIFDYSSVYEDYLRQNTENKFWLVNTNKLVRFYEGADGLKTGHTDAALYCLAATAKRTNMRLIAIVLGEENSKTRNAEAMGLLDYGFSNYKLTKLKSKDQVIKKIILDKSTKDIIEATSKYDVSILESKTTNNTKYKYDIKVNNIKLPLSKGDKIGTISIKNKNKVLRKVDLISSTDAKKLSFLELFLSNLRKSIVGIID